MAIDLWTIAVRLDSDPVRAARRDAEAWEAVSLDPRFTRTLVCPDRSYEQMEYLLDPAAYRGLTSWEQRERSMPYRIVQGDCVFADHARGSQGILWRCSTSAFLETAASTIETLPVAAVRVEFSVAEMISLALYKVPRDENDDTAFERVLGNLRDLAEHYRRLVDKQLDVIFERD